MTIKKSGSQARSINPSGITAQPTTGAQAWKDRKPGKSSGFFALEQQGTTGHRALEEKLGLPRL
jgi:hypothetical protein